MRIPDMRHPPQSPEEMLMRHHVARVMRKNFDQPVFLRREFHRHVVNRDGSSCKIDGERPNLDDGVRTAVAWPPFPSGEALPSTISARSEPPLFDRFIGTMPSSDSSSACMLIVRLLPL